MEGLEGFNSRSMPSELLNTHHTAVGREVREEPHIVAAAGHIVEGRRSRPVEEAGHTAEAAVHRILPAVEARHSHRRAGHQTCDPSRPLCRRKDRWLPGSA